MTVLRSIPNPYFIPWRDWVDTLVGFNPDLYSTVDPNETWRTFAQRLCERVPEAPQPDLFRTWQEWAAGLKEALQA